MVSYNTNSGRDVCGGLKFISFLPAQNIPPHPYKKSLVLGVQSMSSYIIGLIFLVKHRYDFETKFIFTEFSPQH